MQGQGENIDGFHFCQAETHNQQSCFCGRTHQSPLREGRSHFEPPAAPFLHACSTACQPRGRNTALYQRCSFPPIQVTQTQTKTLRRQAQTCVFHLSRRRQLRTHTLMHLLDSEVRSRSPSPVRSRKKRRKHNAQPVLQGLSWRLSCADFTVDDLFYGGIFPVFPFHTYGRGWKWWLRVGL